MVIKFKKGKQKALIVKVKKFRIIPALKGGALPFGILDSKVALKSGALNPSDF
ncbi:MAG: hypothetical protein O2779_00785 [Nanoarchaeota archaeon]|nr:hypothetical protein [Nanoarchaeota archaeon]